MTRHRSVLAFAFLLATLTVAGCRKPTPPPPDLGPPVVTVAHPILDKVTIFTDLTGTVDAKDIVDVRPRVTGYIKEVKFEEGKEVKKDQVLFVIDPVIYKALLGQSEGQVKNYEAQLAKANADLARTKETYERGATSKTELDQMVAAKDVAAAQLYTATKSVDQARQNLEWTEVRAPIAGRISRALLTAGNLATQDQSLLTTIVSVDPMYAYFDADEATVRMYQNLIAQGKIKSVVEGAKVPVEIRLIGETGYPHKGFLEFVDNRINPSTGSLTIRGEFPNPVINGTLRALSAGNYCRGRMPVGKPFEGILIPAEAVSSDQGQKIVYVLGPGNRVETRQVQLGPLTQGLQLVTKGLSTSDTIVIRGLSRIQPGIVVDPHEETIPKPKVEPDTAEEGTTESVVPTGPPTPTVAPQPRAEGEKK